MWTRALQRRAKIGWKSLRGYIIYEQVGTLRGYSICEQAGTGGLLIINYIKPSPTETVDPRALAEEGEKELTVKRM